ncbi:hypothetical protein ACHAXR_004454 [Thalassiosira sp. AJA248-18]
MTKSLLPIAAALIATSGVHGFILPSIRSPTNSAGVRGTVQAHKQNDNPSSSLSSSSSSNNNISRHGFITTAATTALLPILTTFPAPSSAFDGGVGGLGKTRPQTGVVFRDPEAAAQTRQSSSGDVNYELIAPDGSPVFLSFCAPWPLSKSAAGIEARDISGGYESSFVQVDELPKGISSLDKIKPAQLSQNIFGSTGKFGMYGSPTDIKIKKVPQTNGDSGTAIYQATFTTLTPAMRESDRKCYIAAAIVGDGLFLLVTATTAVRFGKLEGTLRKVAESFTAIDAPKSNLNQRKSS